MNVGDGVLDVPLLKKMVSSRIVIFCCDYTE